MTKRFNRVKSTKETIHYNGIEDTEKEVIYNYGKQDDFLEDITQLLNELNDENEELKESNERFSKTVAEQIIMIKEYREENEQLKSDKQALIDFIKMKFPKSYKHILEGFE